VKSQAKNPCFVQKKNHEMIIPCQAKAHRVAAAVGGFWVISGITWLWYRRNRYDARRRNEGRR
jgi:hypothetical protein